MNSKKPVFRSIRPLSLILNFIVASTVMMCWTAFWDFPELYAQQSETQQAPSNPTAEIVAEIEILLQEIVKEVSLIEGEYLVDYVQWIVDRFKNNSKGRIIWSITAALALISLALLFLIIYSFMVLLRPKRPAVEKSIVDKTSTPTNIQPKLAEKPKSKVVGKGISSVSISSHFENGSLKEFEEALLVAVQKGKADDAAMLYLIASRAVDFNYQRFQELIDKLLGHGLDKKSQVYRHAGQIGRLISSESFPITQWPEPEGMFNEKSTLISSDLSAVMTFGDTQTLMDMLTVYAVMDDHAAVKRLVVQLLVYGDASQRAEAIKHARNLS